MHLLADKHIHRKHDHQLLYMDGAQWCNGESQGRFSFSQKMKGKCCTEDKQMQILFGLLQSVLLIYFGAVLSVGGVDTTFFISNVDFCYVFLKSMVLNNSVHF